MTRTVIDQTEHVVSNLFFMDVFKITSSLITEENLSQPLINMVTLMSLLKLL